MRNFILGLLIMIGYFGSPQLWAYSFEDVLENLVKEEILLDLKSLGQCFGEEVFSGKIMDLAYGAITGRLLRSETPEKKAFDRFMKFGQALVVVESERDENTQLDLLELERTLGMYHDYFNSALELLKVRAQSSPRYLKRKMGLTLESPVMNQCKDLLNREFEKARRDILGKIDKGEQKGGEPEPKAVPNGIIKTPRDNESKRSNVSGRKCSFNPEHVDEEGNIPIQWKEKIAEAKRELLLHKFEKFDKAKIRGVSDDENEFLRFDIDGYLRYRTAAEYRSMIQSKTRNRIAEEEMEKHQREREGRGVSSQEIASRTGLLHEEYVKLRELTEVYPEMKSVEASLFESRVFRWMEGYSSLIMMRWLDGGLENRRTIDWDSLQEFDQVLGYGDAIEKFKMEMRFVRFVVGLDMNPTVQFKKIRKWVNDYRLWLWKYRFKLRNNPEDLELTEQYIEKAKSILNRIGGLKVSSSGGIGHIQLVEELKTSKGWVDRWSEELNGLNSADQVGTTAGSRDSSDSGGEDNGNLASEEL